MNDWNNLTNDISLQSGISTPVYGILVATGLICSLLFMIYEWKKLNGSIKIFGWLFFIGSFSGIVGSRWIYLILNPSDIYDALSFFQFGSGRAIMGSVIGGWIGMTLFLKIYHIPIDYRMLISIILPNLLLGQMIGRWGNFYNQEVYGAIVSEDSLNWLIPSIKNHMFIDGAYREPLFLYESIINIIGWLIIGIIFKCVPFFKNNLKPGTHGALYLMWYGITRSSMELFRDEQFIMKIGNIPTSFILAILFVIVGLFLFIYLQFYYWSFQFYKTTILQNKKEYVLCVVKFNWKFILRKISYSNKEKYLAEMKEKMYKEILISRNRTKILYEQMKKEDFYILKGQK